MTIKSSFFELFFEKISQKNREGYQGLQDDCSSLFLLAAPLKNIDFSIKKAE